MQQSIENIKKIILKAKTELKRLNSEIKAKTAKRNHLLKMIINFRKREHHLKNEIAKLDTEIYKINMKIKENKKTLEDAKRFGLW